MNNNFAVFIMVYGRPDKNWTYQSLKKSGYTGKIYLIGDNTDLKINEYLKIYGDNLLIFDKINESKNYDNGDISNDLRSTMYASNMAFKYAEKLGIKYFCLMCDDYKDFYYRYISDNKLKTKNITNLNNVFDNYIEYYKNTNFTSIAFAQGGDFIGGMDCDLIKKSIKRKVMNTFLCCVDRKFEFIGRLNEDVNTYVNLGQKGYLFGTLPFVSIRQKATQSEKNGLTEVYLDNGTYLKSFFSVMYNPNCVKISLMETTHKRIHHIINWNNATPMIIDQKYRK